MLRRTLSLALSVLALMAFCTTAWAGGNKLGAVNLNSTQSPCPMAPGGQATYQPDVIRADAGTGINGNVTATLSLVGLPPSFNATISPATINFRPKTPGGTFTVKITAPGSVAGSYPFQILVTRTSTDFL